MGKKIDFAMLERALRQRLAMSPREVARAIISDDPAAVAFRQSLGVAIDEGHFELKPVPRKLSPEERQRLENLVLGQYEHYLALQGPKGWDAIYGKDPHAPTRPEWAKKCIAEALVEKGYHFAPNTIGAMVTRARNRSS